MSEISEFEVNRLAESWYSRLEICFPLIRSIITLDNCEEHFIKSREKSMCWLSDEEKAAIKIDLKRREERMKENNIPVSNNDSISGFDIMIDEEIYFSRNLIQISDKEIRKENFGNYLTSDQKYAGRTTYQNRAICLLYTVFLIRKNHSISVVDITSDRFCGLFDNAYSNFFPNKTLKTPSLRWTSDKSAILNIAKSLLNDNAGHRRMVYNGNDVTIWRN